MLSVFGGLLLGVLLGLRHAFEPDHLAAVSTLVADRKNARGGLLLGAVWGLGHSLSLLAVGGGLTLLERRLTPSVEQAFECLVAVMLVGLGVRSLSLAARKGVDGPSRVHVHGRHQHVHPASPFGHLHLSHWTLATRPLAIGLVHGLAGSGALTALVLARMPTLAARLVYIALFGLGSAAGMALLSGLAALSLHFVRPSAVWKRALLVSTGTVSLSLGCFWGWTSVQALLAG